MDQTYFTVIDLMERWRKESKKTVYRLIQRYRSILKPVKIGRELLIEIENVKKFEEQMRVIKENEI